jgi:osmotically-inducible protein OsmY
MTGQPELSPPEQDEYLTGHLHQRLAEDPRVSEQGIVVRVAGGEIYLAGVVATRERREAISVVARECCGGHRVHNEVAVCAFPEPTAQESLS